MMEPLRLASLPGTRPPVEFLLRPSFSRPEPMANGPEVRFSVRHCYPNQAFQEREA